MKIEMEERKKLEEWKIGLKTGKFFKKNLLSKSIVYVLIIIAPSNAGISKLLK